ncbi:hypothetical protein EBR21_07175 [bacterium]|nr:hypothetical protein [bacterium]
MHPNFQTLGVGIKQRQVDRVVAHVVVAEQYTEPITSPHTAPIISRFPLQVDVALGADQRNSMESIADCRDVF